MMHRRTSLSFATALLAAAVLVGCTPTPEPTPTPTALFASEDEAYGAAEATYREYVDASNSLQAGDRSADPSSWLIGTAYETSVSSERKRAEQGITVTGAINVFDVSPVSVNEGSTPAIIVMDICLDVGATRIVQDGVDVTPDNRFVRVLTTVEFHATPTEIKIANTDTPDDPEC